MIGLGLYLIAVLTMAAAACGHRGFLPKRRTRRRRAPLPPI
ncbi:hypothetical protein AB8A21_41160 [Streptomyces sp. BF23-18]